MSDDNFRPELVIAVDFGMTCTGVAYCNIATGEETVRWIQKWPGKAGAVENKVPTVLVYPKNSTIPSSWGFSAENPTEQMSDDKDCKEWFKTFLDEEKLRDAQRKSQGSDSIPASMQEVERLYCDFFRLLYQTIQQRLQGELANRWEDASIEFIFSVPTTWKPVPTVERFRSIIKRAGFGKYQNHKCDIGLTEAEAAAVHTARVFPRLFKERDVLLVCDVGGGTTDLSVLRVTNTEGVGSLSLEQMDVVQGSTIGSVQLDTAFEVAVLSRLEMANRNLPTGLHQKELEEVAWAMAKSKEYQNAKCEYGSSDDDTEFFTVAVPKLNRHYENQGAGITSGEMKFRRDEIQGYFDAQILKLFELVDRQLTRLQQKFPTEQVAHLVLSGGLGNSPYVQRRLRDRYSFGRTPFPNARALQVRVAPEPQLVVCKGIVADRVQKLNSGKSVLGWRCSRASYGTMCKTLYNPENPSHFGKTTRMDPLDRKLYVTNCISWFIKQGEPVSIDQPIVKQFTNRCSPATPSDPNPPRIFPTSVVTCDLDKEMLPMVMNASCKKLCEVTSDFSSLPLSTFKLKNRHWWNSGQKFHRIEYMIKVVLGPADIRFELWHNNQKLSKDRPIQIEWHAAQAPVVEEANRHDGYEQAWQPTPRVWR